MSDDTLFRVPLVIRGTVIDDFRAEFPGRRGGGFATAPVSDYLDRLVLHDAPRGSYELSRRRATERPRDPSRRLRDSSRPRPAYRS